MIELDPAVLTPYVGFYDSGTLGVVFPGGYPDDFDDRLKPELESLREYGMRSCNGGSHPGVMGVWVVSDFGWYSSQDVANEISKLLEAYK